eukprot:gb/GEZN01004742.1/.p1 GENE.gb/GEZN01004742.1/~~gb/GEZN01004742.1/.p1  ORF type:complete len:545 (+),score=101.46 gb/GEZN01004742.1/:46-1680(+)
MDDVFYCRQGHPMKAPGLAPGTAVACPTCNEATAVPNMVSAIPRPSDPMMPEPAYGSQQGSMVYQTHQPAQQQQQQQQHQPPPGQGEAVAREPNPDTIASKGDLEFKGGQCNDVFWLVLWVLDVAAVILVIVIHGQDYYNSIQEGTTSTTQSPSTAVDMNYSVMLISAIIGSLFAVVWAYAWLKIMQAAAGKVIYTGIVLNVIFWVIYALGMLFVGMFFWGILALLFCALLVWYYRAVRSRIPFAEAVLAACSEAIRTNSAAVCVTLVMAILSIFWSFVFAVSSGAYVNHAEADGHLDALDQVIIFLLLVSFYWTAQVLKNIGHVTTAGAVAMWWLQPGADGKVWGAFRRAVTTSLGSICCGSLIVAILQATRAVLKQAMQGENAAVQCVVMCIIGCIESLIEYFNKYAYTYVAIYGYDFRKAASTTWSMLKRAGFDAIINDDLTGLALTLGILFGALLGGVVGLLLGVMSSNCRQDCYVLSALISLVIAALLTGLVMGVVESAVATTFVLWAEDPAVLGQTRPETFEKIRYAAAQRYPDARVA